MKSASLTVRLTTPTGGLPSNTVENFRLHLGAAIKDPSVVEHSSGRLGANIEAETTDIACAAVDVEAFLERVRGWLTLNPGADVKVIDSEGHVLLKADAAPPKVVIDPLKPPDHIPDAGFTLELRVGRPQKPSTKNAHIPDKDFS